MSTDDGRTTKVAHVTSQTPISRWKPEHVEHALAHWDRATALFHRSQAVWIELMRQQAVDGEALPQGVPAFREYVEFVRDAFLPFVEAPATVALPTPWFASDAHCPCGEKCNAPVDVLGRGRGGVVED